MTNLSVFNFHNSNVRIQLSDNNEALFCLTDVVEILNIKNAHASRFNFSEEGIHKMYTLTKGGKQELIFINEPNLYRVIFRSNKKEAVEFQNWVFDEVLPAIRKTGKYELPKKTTVDQRTPLRDAVNLLVSKKAITYSEAYSIIHQRFNVASIEDLPQDQLSQAVEYVHRVALEGELIPHQKEQLITISLENFYDLAWVCNVSRYMHKRIEKITPALEAIESDFYGVFRSMTVDHRMTISTGVNVAREIINKFNIPHQLADGRYFPNLESLIKH